MAKKKKLKQTGQRKEVSETGNTKIEQSVSGEPVSGTPGTENGMSLGQQNSSSKESRREVTTSSFSNVNILKRPKDKPASGYVGEQSTGQGSESRLKPAENLVETKGSKKHKNLDQKKAGVSGKKPNVIEEFTETPGQKISKQAKQKKDTTMGKMEQRLNMRKKKIKDPRLIPRMKEYLDNRPNKNFVSIPQMAEYLQEKYPEYGRKKKSMFIQYVDKAYTYMEKPAYTDPPPPLSDTDENSNTEKELVEEDGHYVWKNVSEHSKDISDVEADDGGDEVTVDNDSYSSSDDDEKVQLVEYKDSNAINNRLMNMYRSSPTHVSKTVADDRKRKTLENQGSTNVKKSKSESKVLYPSPYVLERNISSTGLVGPRRTPNDKYFIDRKGDNSGLKKGISETEESREVTIQKFLGNLPSRTSFGTYVSGKIDPRIRGGTLYRVYSGKKETEEETLLKHSGITLDNVGVTSQAPESPVSGSEENEPVTLNDPRIQQNLNDTERMAGVGKDMSSQGISDGKDKVHKTPRKKKTSKLRKQVGSDSESTEKGSGLAVQKSSVTFADVGGNEANLIEICKLLVHMRHPEVYQQLGVTPPRGFLLHGPPGCGKTLLANAIAGELDLALIKLAATEIVSGVSGNSEEKIRELFDKATQSAPCVVFIDEIDAITPKRETASKDMERRIVAQLLACMDDLNANPNCHVLVIGATNRPDSLDPALRRAGRFDREICLGIPDEPSRLRILQVLCRNLRLSADFDFKYMAHNTPGYVGADLMALTREAAMTAVNRVFQDLQSAGKNVVEIEECFASETVVSYDKCKTDISYNQIGSCSVLSETGTTSNIVLQGTNSVNQSNFTAFQSGHNENVTQSISVGIETGTISDSVSQTNNSGLNQSSISAIQLRPNEFVSQSNAAVNKGQPGTSMTLEKMGSNLGSEADLQLASKSSSSLVTSQDNLKECDLSQQKIENAMTEDVNQNVKDISRTTEETVTDSAKYLSNMNKNEVDKVMDIEVSAKAQANETAMEVDSESIEKNKKTSENNRDSSVEMKSAEDIRGSEFASVLSWLKEHPPLTESQLADLYITMDDFKEALKYVQPSAKREGFATIPDVTWDDIGALHEVREELQLAILAPVRHPEEFKSLGLTRAQGVLLAGPPGCGKTLLAKAVANESGINFISVKGPELLNMYVGESERAVRTVFQRARNSAPCVIFFDELDALCPRRSGSSEGNSSARVVNQLLTEMDGLEERKQVFIMAATNRPDIIDPAVLRPGRLDKTLYVGLPTVSDRLDILTCITKNGTKPKLAEDVNLTKIAEDTRCNCFTGADLAALVREASIAALKEAILIEGRQSSSIITVKGEHFNTAFRKIKPSVTPKDHERYDSMRSKLAIGT